MKHSVQVRPPGVWICVLLALLILYNPFAALTGSAGTISVQRQARHRATVGSSELQHLGAAQDQNPQEFVELREIRKEVGEPATQQKTQGLQNDVEVLQPESVSRVWSRPPPLV